MSAITKVICHGGPCDGRVYHCRLEPRTTEFKVLMDTPYKPGTVPVNGDALPVHTATYVLSEEHEGLAIFRWKNPAVGDLIARLQGEWDVKSIGSGIPLNLLHDRKIIQGQFGNNVIGVRSWGYFTVEGNGPRLILNYNDPRNPRRLRTVTDFIKPDGDDWTGTLFMKGNPIFRFRLVKRQQQTPTGGA